MMHITDVARISTAHIANDDDGLGAARGIAYAIIVSVPVWSLIFLIGALAWRWLA